MNFSFGFFLQNFLIALLIWAIASLCLSRQGASVVARSCHKTIQPGRINHFFAIIYCCFHVYFIGMVATRGYLIITVLFQIVVEFNIALSWFF